MSRKFDNSRLAIFISLLTLSAGVAFLFLLAVGAIHVVAPENEQHSYLLDQRGPIFALVLCMASALYALWSIMARQIRAQKAASDRIKRRAIEFQKQTIEEHCILCIVSSDGIIERVNRNFQDAFGYTPEQIEGTAWHMMLDDRVQQDNRVAIHRQITAGSAWTGEATFRRKSGEPLVANVSLAPEKFSDRKHVRTLMLLTDITSSRIAERDEFFSTTLEELQDEIYVYEADTLQIRYVNRAARRRCGWSWEDARERMISDTAPNFDVSLFRKHTHPLLTGDQETVIIEVTHPNGPVEIATRLTRGADGKRQFVSVLRDLAHRKEIEDAKIETVSTISHELRAPLTSIKGGLRLLQSGAVGELSEKASEVVGIANKNSDRLLFIISDILDLEKMRAGKMEISMNEVNLVDLVRDTMELNRRYADGYGVRIEATQLPDAAWSTGDYDRLVQVLTNLVTNAVKYSPRNGTVRLGLSRRHDAWRFSVSDDGPGIPEDNRHLIGRPFAQIAGADGKKRDGSGLGLTIVKKILKKHGARLEFQSTVGVGTEFWFTLPDRDGEATPGIEQEDDSRKVVSLESAAAQGRG